MPKRARSNSSNGSEAAARKELEKKKRVDAIETAVAVPGNGEGREHFPKVVLPSETVALDGHSAAVLSLDFEPTMGNCLVTAGMDKVVLVWDLSVEGECINNMTLGGHKHAIQQCCWGTTGDTVFTASADKTVGVFDANTGKRTRKFKGHESHVNSVCRTGLTSSPEPVSGSLSMGSHTVASCSNDCSVMLWDTRAYRYAMNLKHSFPLTAVTFTNDGGRCFSGGVDESVQEWDLRKSSIIRQYNGHHGTVTDLKASPDDSYILSNGMDGQLLCWDICGAAASDVITTPYKRFVGAAPAVQEHGMLRCGWSADMTKVAAGSNDCTGFVWDFDTCDVAQRLGGHRGCVNDVAFHPGFHGMSQDNNIAVTCGNDGGVIMGRL